MKRNKDSGANGQESRGQCKIRLVPGWSNMHSLCSKIINASKKTDKRKETARIAECSLVTFIIEIAFCLLQTDSFLSVPTEMNDNLT